MEIIKTNFIFTPKAAIRVVTELSNRHVTMDDLTLSVVEGRYTFTLKDGHEASEVTSAILGVVMCRYVKYYRDCTSDAEVKQVAKWLRKLLKGMRNYW